jgi:hypothetical protein
MDSKGKDTPMSNEQLIQRLRHFGDAYPLDVWPPLTEEERRSISSSLRSRIAAEMGRHCSKIMAEAADALAEAESDSDETHRVLMVQSKLLTHTVNILRGPPPDLTSWSHHDIPELAAVAVKYNTQLGLFAKLSQNTLHMLAESARMLLETMELEEARATRPKDQYQEGSAAEGDVPMADVQENPRPPTEGGGDVDLLLQREVDGPVGTAQCELAALANDLHGGEAPGIDRGAASKHLLGPR